MSSIRFLFKSFHPSYLQPLKTLVKSNLSNRPWNPIFERSNLYSLPKKSKIFTVLRSPHVDKKSREQFELNISKLGISLTSLNLFNPKTSTLTEWFDVVSSFFKLKTPAGIGLVELRALKIHYKNK